MCGMPKSGSSFSSSSGEACDAARTPEFPITGNLACRPERQNDSARAEARATFWHATHRGTPLKAILAPLHFRTQRGQLVIDVLITAVDVIQPVNLRRPLRRQPR